MQIKVSTLTHHPQNGEIYNLSNIDDLVDSISEVGLLSPLIIDKQNQVISGNRRLAAIKTLGWEKVSVEVADVSDEDVVGILIHHNKQRVKSTREILNEYFALEKIHGKGQGRRTDLETSGSSTKGGVARDVIAEKVGLSSSQMSRILFIEKRQPSLIDEIDGGRLTVNKAWEGIRYGNMYGFKETERNRNDFYNTPKSLTEYLFKVEDFDFDKTVCEPACGQNAITDVLKQRWSSSLITSYDREIDFLRDNRSYDYIITNPPFSQALDFIKQAKKRATNKFCFLMPLNYLHGKARYNEVYSDKRYGLSAVHVFTRSLLLDDQPIRHDGKAKAGMLVLAWYVFTNGYSGHPALSWIDNGSQIH